MAEPIVIAPGGGSSRAVETIVILVVLVVGAWFVFTRLKKPDPIVVDKPPQVPPEDKAPPLADTGKVRQPHVSSTIFPPCPAGQTRKLTTERGIYQYGCHGEAPPKPQPIPMALVVEKPAPVTAPPGAVAVPGPAPPQQSKPVSNTLLGVAGRPALVTMPQPIAPKPVPPPPPPAPPPPGPTIPPLTKAPMKATPLTASFSLAKPKSSSTISGLRR